MKKPEKSEKRLVEFRLSIVLASVFLSMMVLIVRVGYLQVKVGNQFVDASQLNAYDSLVVPAPRGWIYDRYHTLLAADKPTYNIVYTRLNAANSNGTIPLDSSVQSGSAIAKLLDGPFGMSFAALTKVMEEDNSGNPQVTILQDASEAAVSYVEEHMSALPGVSVVTTPVRYYPYGALAGHILGFIGAIPPKETNYYVNQLNYQPNAQVGLDGIEAQYDRYLQGQPGTLRVEVNSANVPIRNLGLYPPPTPGDNLVLNVDAHLQEVLQQALVSQIQSLRVGGYPWINSAVAVAMDPQNGAVLALGSYPFYNPQWFIGGISQKHYQQYAQAADNLAISGLYMPGSTEKPLTLMYALNKGVINPNTTVYDPGYLYVGNTLLHEWVPYGFGTVTLPQALEKSSDVYLYQVGLWLGHYPPRSGNINAWMNGPRVQAFNGLAKFARNFGLTVPTQIDLPNEAVGSFHDSGYLSDLAYMAIGQDQLYTAIGLAQYTSAIANGGTRYKPEVLHQILSPTGQVLKTVKPVVLNKIPVSKSYLDLIREGMLWVTQKRNGTAWSVFLGDKYTVAGKTGTAELGVNGQNNAVFIGWAPYDHPKIAVAVIVPGAGEGYTSAGPISRKIIDAYLNQLTSGNKAVPVTPIHPSTIHLG